MADRYYIAIILAKGMPVDVSLVVKNDKLLPVK
jgi:hypothetical protein